MNSSNISNTVTGHNSKDSKLKIVEKEDNLIKSSDYENMTNENENGDMKVLEQLVVPKNDLIFNDENIELQKSFDNNFTPRNYDKINVNDQAQD